MRSTLYNSSPAKRKRTTQSTLNLMPAATTTMVAAALLMMWTIQVRIYINVCAVFVFQEWVECIFVLMQREVLLLLVHPFVRRYAYEHKLICAWWTCRVVLQLCLSNESCRRSSVLVVVVCTRPSVSAAQEVSTSYLSRVTNIRWLSHDAIQIF